ADGPLLGALRAGDWVLLDELNLANQSVLEGLNAMLDHRAQVFIPELGRTFDCPPGFRVFAAQNPVQEGGGRKGLPKSFLNRFTRVHCQVLHADDLLFVTQMLYPGLDGKLLSKMVAFLQSLQQACASCAGGPWEFNLRDLLRWCDLIVRRLRGKEGTSEAGTIAPSDQAAWHFASMLFFQRFRTPDDAAMARALMKKAWGVARFGDEDDEGGLAARPDVLLSNDLVLVGWASVSRAPTATPPRGAALPSLRLLQSQLPALETLFHCVENGWMALLVGGSGAGKSTLVRLTARLCGADLVELPLTQGTDTSDLLGGFEQTEPARAVHSLALRVLRCLRRGAAIAARDAVGAEVAAGALQTLGCAEKSVVDVEEDVGRDDALSGHAHLVARLQAVQRAAALAESVVLPGWDSAELGRSVQAAARLLAELETDEQGAASKGGRFEWVDGPLTSAIEQGQWVLLDNANLCNPTVLDRLNALLEPRGTLQLNECGCGANGPRVVLPHPDFRLFLTVDPRRGEVSRAMRNRGIEVFSSPPDLDAQFQAEIQDLAAQEGMGDPDVAAAMAATHVAAASAAARLHRPPFSLRHLHRWVRLTQQLVLRGDSLRRALEAAFDEAYMLADDGDEELAQAMQTAYGDHCPARLRRSTERSVTLHRPSAWPVAVSATHFAGNAAQAVVDRDVMVLQHFLLLALAAAGVPHALVGPASALRVSALPYRPFLAAMEGEDRTAGGSAEVALSAPMLERCLAAVKLVLERASQQDASLRALTLAAMLQGLRTWVQDCGRVGASIVALAESLVDCLGSSIAPRLVAEHALVPAAHAATCQALQPRAHVDGLAAQGLALATQVAILGGELNHVKRCSGDDPAAAATLLQVSCWRFFNAMSREQLSIGHPIVDWLWPLLTSAASAMQQFLIGCPAAALDYERLDQVLEWVWALVRSVHPMHGIGTAGELDASTLETLVFAWNQLRAALALWTSEAQGEEWARFVLATVRSVDGCLGYHGDLVAEPCLWEFGGHPHLSWDPAITRDTETVQRLADMTRLGQENFGADMMGLPAALSHARVVPENLSAALADEDVAEETRTQLCEGIAATVFADTPLRRAILQAIALLGSAATVGSSDSATGVDSVAKTLQAHVQERVAAATESVQRSIDSRARDWKETWQLGPHDEALPAQSLVLSFGRAMQLELLNFQTALQEPMLLSLLSKPVGVLSLLVSSSAVDPADARRAASIVASFSRRSVADAAPLAQLAWLADPAGARPLISLRQSVALEAWHRWLAFLWTVPSTGPGLPAHWACGPSGLHRPRLSLAASTIVLQSQSLSLRQRNVRVQQLKCAARALLRGPGAERPVAELEWQAAVLLLAATLQAHAPVVDLDDRPEFERLLRWLAEERAFGDAQEADIAASRALLAVLQRSKHKLLSHLLAAVWEPLLSILLQQQAACTRDGALRGRAWMLLGVARLHLLVPPVSGDPAAQSQLMKRHLEASSAERWEPEAAVRELMHAQQGGLSERAHVRELRARIGDAVRQAGELAGLCTARPRPPQYFELRSTIAAFVEGACALDKVAQLATLPAAAQLQTLQESVLGWCASVGERYAWYRDLVQPVQTAALEIAYGANLLHDRISSTPASHVLIQALVAYPCHPKALARPLATLQAEVEASARAEPEARTKRLALQRWIDLLVILLRDAAKALTAPEPLSVQHRERLRTRLSDVFVCFVDVWETIKAEEERRAIEEAEMFKTKVRSTHLDTDDEESEFAELFPKTDSLFREFEDQDLMEEAQEAAMPDAESAFASRKLVAKAVLPLVVAVHELLYTRSAASFDASMADVEDVAYALGSALLTDAAAASCEELDRKSWTAQLQAMLRQLSALRASRAELEHTSFDVMQPSYAEATLVQAPLAALQDHLSTLLEQWPEHPVLVQLDGIADRLLDVPTTAPMKTFMTGLEMLLHSLQQWEKTAAKHVSLDNEIAPLSSLANRWRRIEVEGWRATLDNAVQRAARVAQQGWFHLYRMFANSGPLTEGTMADLFHSMEEFLRGSKLGEFGARLRLVRSFAAQLELSGQPASTMLHALCQYYEVFLPAIDAAVDKGLEPVRKELQDFVRLSKWEDRNYHSMRANVEKSQRQLHSLSRKTNKVLGGNATSLIDQDSWSVGVPKVSKETETTVCLDTTSAVLLAFWENAEALDQQASDIAARAAELREDGKKGHALRKRAALTMLLENLQQTVGVSKLEADLPLQYRSPRGWFEMVSYFYMTTVETKTFLHMS
ncbi:hypothetical protein H632_c15p0, partial [Helicosporidium sp. ATCC 50920]